MIIITDRGTLTVWDGARLIYERQLTLHEVAAHQVSVAAAMRQMLSQIAAPIHGTPASQPIDSTSPVF